MKIDEKTAGWNFEKRWIAFILLALGFLIYFNSLHNAMFWDDDDFILKNRYIQDWKFFPKYFTENVIAGNYLLGNYWRPVLLMLFSVEWHWWKDWAPGWHLVSILFHSLDSVLLFCLLDLLTKKRWVSFLTALVFLTHPIQTEAVVYANAISDSLACFFIFIALIAYIKFRRSFNPGAKKLFYLGTLLLYPLALMSKETAFVLPAYLFIVDFLLDHDLPFLKKFKKSLTAISLFLVIAGIYLWLRATHLNFVNTFNFYNEENLLTSHFYVRLFTFFHVLCIYFGLLFFPFDLHVERSVPLELSFFHWPVVLGALIFGGLIFWAYRNFRKSPITTFAVIWFFIGILPSSNLIIPINALLYEHFLYAPMIGIFLAVIDQGVDLAIRFKLQKKCLALFLVYLAYFCAVTVDRNRDWKDPVAFYENLLHYSPKSYRVINNLGMMYADRKFYQKAEENYLRAIALDRKNPVGYHNLAGTYRDTGRIEEAAQAFKEAIKLNPQFIFSYKSLAKLYLDAKRWPEARSVLEEFLNHTDEKISILTLLAQIAYDQRDISGSKKYLKKALELDPTNQTIQAMLADFR